MRARLNMNTAKHVTKKNTTPATTHGSAAAEMAMGPMLTTAFSSAVWLLKGSVT